MKIRWFLTAGLMILILAISACAAGTQAETSAEEPEAPAAAPVEVLEEAQEEETQAEAPAADEIDVEALIIERLEGAHSLQRVLDANITTREKWEETIDRMIGYGAKITPEEKELMIDWLMNR